MDKRQEPYPADKARGGEIILSTPARRTIFVAGLIGAFCWSWSCRCSS